MVWRGSVRFVTAGMEEYGAARRGTAWYGKVRQVGLGGARWS
jgi:hypothetical protein